MNKLYACTAMSALAVTTAGFAQSSPNPNPVPNVDGTHTYYCGQGMVWNTIQSALDDSRAGDEIVIVGGAGITYNESITVSKAVTVRCMTELTPSTVDINNGNGNFNVDADIDVIIKFNYCQFVLIYVIPCNSVPL